ncbi:MAG: SGNH/GDSL hydrolase family protein, partial [Gammaproteobacteria bacterium]|nr:SGNH/GDSL hydrolase family protein [Gammaproteobacteria bacterium]
MKKKSTLYFLMSAVVLFFILLAGETLARWFVTPARIPAPPPPLSVIDPYKANSYAMSMRPYLQFHIPGGMYIQARSYYRVKYEINSMGFRGPEFLEKKRTGLKRLLIIGDSMVEGHGCEFTNTFSYRLGEKGRKHGWEVLNIGVQGANPIYYAANVERYLSLRPDAVLLVLFENDVFEDRIQEGRFFNLPVLDNENALLMGHANKKFLFESRLYVLLRRAWKKFVR